MIVIDSNIIVYAINKKSPKHTVAQKFLLNTKKLVFFHQNIFESIRVLTHSKYPNPMNIDEAIKSVSAITDVGKILSPTIQTFEIALALLRQSNVAGNRVFDMYLLATMLSHNIEIIATDNEKDFKVDKGIRIINPFRY